MHKMIFYFHYVFFFQAEDGIRDIGVTGVQTCALPISREAAASARWSGWTAGMSFGPFTAASATPARNSGSCGPSWRSEERRVGKECRSRGSPYPLKKKNITQSQSK